MRFLVALDPRSHIGNAYLNGNNDGTTIDGCPVIDCSSIDSSGVYFSCTRDTKSQGGSNQELLIPHQAIAYCLTYAKQADRPIGFLASPK